MWCLPDGHKQGCHCLLICVLSSAVGLCYSYSDTRAAMVQQPCHVETSGFLDGLFSAQWRQSQSCPPSVLWIFCRTSNCYGRSFPRIQSMTHCSKKVSQMVRCDKELTEFDGCHAYPRYIAKDRPFWSTIRSLEEDLLAMADRYNPARPLRMNGALSNEAILITNPLGV